MSPTRVANLHLCTPLTTDSMYLPRSPRSLRYISLAFIVLLTAKQAAASLGDHLPEFRECVQVRGKRVFETFGKRGSCLNRCGQIENCENGRANLGEAARLKLCCVLMAYVFPALPLRLLPMDVPVRMRLHLPTCDH